MERDFYVKDNYFHFNMNDKALTPCELEVLIHCHVSASVHPRVDAPAVREAIDRFLGEGVVESADGPFYRTTEKGRAWLDMILSTPMPIEKWVDPRFEE